MNPSQRTARLAGLLYLIVFVFAGFSEGYVRAGVQVPGDPAATAQNVADAELLFRIGFATDLVAFMSDAAVALLLYVLLKPAGPTLALMAAGFRLIAHPAIGSLNLLNHLAAGLLATGAGSLGSFEADRLEALTLFALDLHGYGYLIGGAFFGVHLILLGILIYRSEMIPRIIGVLIGIAAAGYLIESFGTVLAPTYADIYLWTVAVPAVIGEGALCLWLLIKGVQRPAGRTT